MSDGPATASLDESIARDDATPDLPPELRGAAVVVTGGGGFVGSRLTHTLAASCDVTVVDDFSTGDPDAVPPAASVVRGDVRDVDTVHRAMQDADIVFHQAALADVGQSVRAPVETHGRNATGTVSVLDAARRADTRVVLASSAAVYGPPATLPVDETAPKRPVSPYGVAKLAADHYAQVYHESYGLPTVALRYFNVYGPGRTEGGVVETFLARARAGETLVVHGDGTQTRDFVHVDDVVRANLQAAVTDATGRAYNVGTGESVSIRTIAERVQSLTGGRSQIAYGPAREGDIDRSRAATERAANDLGFRAQIDIEDGLGRLADTGLLAGTAADD
jgi:UDP-glucose 4-epimerase